MISKAILFLNLVFRAVATVVFIGMELKRSVTASANEKCFYNDNYCKRCGVTKQNWNKKTSGHTKHSEEKKSVLLFSCVLLWPFSQPKHCCLTELTPLCQHLFLDYHTFSAHSSKLAQIKLSDISRPVGYLLVFVIFFWLFLAFSLMVWQDMLSCWGTDVNRVRECHEWGVLDHLRQ